MPPFWQIRGTKNAQKKRFAPGARRFETLQVNHLALIGFRAAMNFANGIGTNNIQKLIFHLGDQCREALRAIPQVRIRDEGEPGKQLGFSVFTIDGIKPHNAWKQIQRRSIDLSVCEVFHAPGSMKRRGLHPLGALRASIGLYNNADDFERLATVVKHIITPRPRPRLVLYPELLRFEVPHSVQREFGDQDLWNYAIS